MRVILYTGKGGVGKTSIAAATACRLAENGKKVLLMSTDQAHSLSDSLDMKLANEPVSVFQNLDAMEIDTVAEAEKAWGELKDYLKRLLTAHSGESIEVEELLVFPGFEELLSLFRLLEICENGKYEVVIVDCAPTGETISMLKYPEMFGHLLEKFLPMKRKAIKVAGPVIEKAVKIPMPKDSVFDQLEELTSRLGRLQNLMVDRSCFSIRIVTTPEKIVVAEAKKNLAWMHLYDFNVDAVIVNKIYPKESMNGYFQKWIERQEEGIREIREGFGRIPVFCLELLKTELRTVKRLTAAADTIYGEQDPGAVLAEEKIYCLQKKEGEYRLTIELSSVKKEDMQLEQNGLEITLAVKNERRTFTLPEVLGGYEIAGAKQENDRLTVRFQREEHAS